MGEDTGWVPRGGDTAFLVTFVLFAITSFAFEPFVVFGCGGDGGLAACAKAFEEADGAGWYLWPGAVFHWYAESFDPVFLYTPGWLMIMCALDMVLFGPAYLVLMYGFLKRRLWVRWVGLAYASAITYSCVVYFAYVVSHSTE